MSSNSSCSRSACQDKAVRLLQADAELMAELTEPRDALAAVQHLQVPKALSKHHRNLCILLRRLSGGTAILMTCIQDK